MALILLVKLVHPLDDAVASVDAPHQLPWLFALVLELDEQEINSAEVSTFAIHYLTDVGLELETEADDVLVEAENSQEEVEGGEATHRLLQFL